MSGGGRLLCYATLRSAAQPGEGMLQPNLNPLLLKDSLGVIILEEEHHHSHTSHDQS